ncbi:hypothetical protein [Phocaeicola sp.]
MQCSLYKVDEKDFFGMLMATEGMDMIGMATRMPI